MIDCAQQKRTTYYNDDCLLEREIYVGIYKPFLSLRKQSAEFSIQSRNEYINEGKCMVLYIRQYSYFDSSLEATEEIEEMEHFFSK